jgi:hypothetical protein
MYIIRQVSQQFSMSFYTQLHPAEAWWNVEAVETKTDALMGADDVKNLATDAHKTAEKMWERWKKLQAWADELIGWEGSDVLTWGESNDVLAWGEWDDRIVDEANSLSPEEERASVIAELEAGGQFTEWMNEVDREALIQTRLDANNVEKPLTEEEIQAQDAKHQEILEYGRSLGLEWLDEEEIQNVFWDMTQDEISEFEAMSPEEQTAFMLWKSETLMASNEAILAAKEAELEAERAAWVTQERAAAIVQEQWQIQSARNVISWRGPGNTWFFRWRSENAMIPWGEAGTLTPEQLAEFWPMWWELAEFALTCPVATAEKSYCGKNTWEMLNSYYRSIWKPDLQINDRPRHGYVWASLLSSRPDQFKEISVTPENAPVWSLISYAAGPGWSSAFAQYGHIETKCSQNQYHFWQVASSPGWSKRPPQEGEYRVFMPTTKTA